jgi:hypothetical protein
MVVLGERSPSLERMVEAPSVDHLIGNALHQPVVSRILNDLADEETASGRGLEQGDVEH